MLLKKKGQANKNYSKREPSAHSPCLPRVQPLPVLCTLFLHFCKRLFSGLEPMTSWSQGNSITAASGLPLANKNYSIVRKIVWTQKISRRENASMK
jgi:hypothetical protein